MIVSVMETLKPARRLALLALAASLPVLAQSSSDKQSPQLNEAVTVTTAIEPVPLSESNRSVTVLDTREQPLLYNNVTDYLRQDTSVNLQSRAANGVQADLSLRGTTFEQSLLLVNGLRVNDPQASHLNMDIAIPLDAMARVEVLHGSGSTFYGSDAIGGAINLQTTRPDAARRFTLLARSGAGSYGSLENHLRADYTAKRVAEQITGSRDTSNGFMVDRNYSSNALASETWLDLLPLGSTDLLLAGSDRPYGANQFYGAYNSWERTKGWFAAIQQQLGSRSSASFAYRKHTDLFVLLLDRPNYYRNNHSTGAWQTALRRADPLGANTTLSYGIEANGDSIRSSNLGVHARNQGAGYVNLSLRSLKRLSLSIGAREQGFTGPAGGAVFSPSVAAAYTLTGGLRLRGAVGNGYRQPTYTDLYYTDPTTSGNAGLKAERSWSYEGGVDWTPGRAPLTLTATGFSLRQRNGIDYAKYSLAAKWQAMNVSEIAYNGAEASARLRLPGRQELRLGYTAVEATAPPAGLISKYAFNYAAQSALIAWSGEIAGQVAARSQLAVVQRTTQAPYAVWDLALSRSKGSFRPYVRAMNLNDARYEEVPAVPVQGRTVMAGAELSWSRRR